MARFQLRLSTLVLLVVTTALAIALIFEWRREAALADSFEQLKAETNRELMESRRLDIARQQRIDQLEDMPKGLRTSRGR
jgi:hypothetical protein